MKLTKEELLAAVKAACNVKAGWSDEAQKALEERENMANAYYWLDKRYAAESQELAILANKQLNLEKNVKKGDFEDVHLYRICELLDFEQVELEKELFDFSSAHLVTVKEKINYSRAKEEIGDVAACLTGLLVKLNKMEAEEK